MKHLSFGEVIEYETKTRNLLPQMCRPKPDRPLVGLYRWLGAMVLLDIEACQGIGRICIRDYFERVYPCLNDRMVFIGFTSDRRPMGYVSWRSDSNDYKLNNTHMTAPFGNCVELQQMLRETRLRISTVPNKHDVANFRIMGQRRVDFYAAAGYALNLLAWSKYHQHYEMVEYFCVEIMPAIERGQVRFYLTSEGIPQAMVTWAWLSNAVEHDVHAIGRALEPEEWDCGDRLFFNDWVTVDGNTRAIVRDMTHYVFPNELATSLRRRPDGTVRRINRWVGVNRRGFQSNEISKGRGKVTFPEPEYRAR